MRSQSTGGADGRPSYLGRQRGSNPAAGYSVAKSGKPLQTANMEQHRARIEADHNEGIPAAEWETMEVIIGMYLRENSLHSCAAAYEVKEAELRQWLGVKQQPRRLSMRIYTEACERRTAVVSRDTERKRIKRGMDPINAAYTPPMTSKKRATLAASARWERRTVGW